VVDGEFPLKGIITEVPDVILKRLGSTYIRQAPNLYASNKGWEVRVLGVGGVKVTKYDTADEIRRLAGML
jgi:hypothetical protein